MSIPFKSDIELNKIVSNDLDLEINGLKLNGSTGTEGQVLTSTGSGAPVWSTVSGGSGEGTSGTTTNSLTITLNGISTSFNGSIERNLTLYAPTSAGTNGYILQSNGSGAPSWVDASSIGGGGSGFSLTLNGNSVSSATIYAPTTAGSDGYLLQSEGTGNAPTWRQVSDSSSASALTSSSTAIPTVRDIYNGLPYINGSHSYTRSTYIYAPISVGTSGQILQSDGSGAPIWVDPSNIGGGGSNGTTTEFLNITLNGADYAFNGSTERNLSFYAPTSAGTDGYLLFSNGTGKSPTWSTLSLYLHTYTLYIGVADYQGYCAFSLLSMSSSTMTYAQIANWLYTYITNGNSTSDYYAVLPASGKCGDLNVFGVTSTNGTTIRIHCIMNNGIKTVSTSSSTGRRLGYQVIKLPLAQ